MASSSKPTGVHYGLVFSVLLNIVCGVGWLLAYKGAGSIGELRSQLNSKTSDAQKADSALKVAADQIDQMKKLVGEQYADVGTDTSTPNTVLWGIQKLIQDFGEDNKQPTLHDTLVKMHEALRNVTAERDKLQEALATELATFQQQKDAMNAMLAQEKGAREAADTGKTNADNTHAEELKKKEQDLAELRNQVAKTQQEYDEYKASNEAAQKQLNARIQNLQAINRKIGDELEQKTRTSFEVADGAIDWIDTNSKRVFINIGEIDGLRPRTTFSVFRKNHGGIGRGSKAAKIGPEDIKGSIEVTRVTGPHQAEARIIDEDIYNPIGKGDPIYSPLWTAGRAEFFSAVGIMDLDGDGKSDRELFRELIATAGGKIDNEVDDNGNLLVNGKPSEDGEPKLTERTKFLVKGALPEPEAGPTDSEENSIKIKTNDLNKKMDQQARERGIRVVSLNDFLAFIGYKSQRRLFVPGEEAPYQLKNAGRGAAAPQPKPGSVTYGNVSGAYSGDNKLRTPGSSSGSANYRNGARTGSSTKDESSKGKSSAGSAGK